MGKVMCNVEEVTVLPLESVFIEMFKPVETVTLKSDRLKATVK